jgi:hypothetical protein
MYPRPVNRGGHGKMTPCLKRIGRSFRDLAVNGRYIRGFATPAYETYEEEAGEMAQVIEDIAKLAGLSVDETKRRLAAAIKDDAWEQTGVDYLMGQNLINQTRPAGAPISWGEFGIVLSRALVGVKK